MNRQAAGGIRQQRERNVPRRLRCSTLLAAAPPKASLSVRCTLNALAGAGVHGRAYEARNSPKTCLARDASRPRLRLSPWAQARLLSVALRSRLSPRRREDCRRRRRGGGPAGGPKQMRRVGGPRR